MYVVHWFETRLWFHTDFRLFHLHWHDKKNPVINAWHGNVVSLQLRHNGRDSVSNHQPHDCLLNRLFRRRWKKTSKLCVIGFCAGNSPGTGEFPTQMTSNAENVSIWWRHHVYHWPFVRGFIGSPVTASISDIWCFLVIRPNDLLKKIAVPSLAMPRHSCDVTIMIYIMLVQIWWTKASFFIAIKRLCSSYILNWSSMQLTFCECQQCRSKIYT